MIKRTRIFAVGVTISFATTMLIGGCGESREEAYQRGVEDGFEEGFDQGKTAGLEEAYECVRDEGGSAEDAADSCE